MGTYRVKGMSSHLPLMPGDHPCHLKIHGSKRRYLLHFPLTIGSPEPLPLIMMLPGTGGTAHWTMRETAWGEIADREWFLVVIPEALPADLAKPARVWTNPRSWRATDVDYLNAVLDDVLMKVPADPRRLYVTGFSSGANMAFRFAAASSHRLAAVAPVAGYCPPDVPMLARPLPTLFLVGTKDPLVPLQGGQVRSPWGGMLDRRPVQESIDRWAGLLGCSSQPAEQHRSAGIEVVRYGPCRNGVVFDVAYVAGLGHHWPGGLGLLPEKIAGKHLPAPKATELIWKFFQHPASDFRALTPG
jgi:polyhydroxybutyrate depolymerase